MPTVQGLNIKDKMIKLIYETHSTSFDNEAGIASGHFDVDLSPTGERQAAELGARYKNISLDAVYYPDQLRAKKTVSIAFAESSVPCIEDPRLRECDYGELTRIPMEDIKKQRKLRIDTPYPEGESYTDTSNRIKAFLNDLRLKHSDGDTALVIGNRAVQYGLEHWLNNTPLEDAVNEPFKWQPGWNYSLEKNL